MNRISVPELEQTPSAEEHAVPTAEQALHSEDCYASEPRLRDLPVHVRNLPRFLCLLLIRGYQKTFSRLLPGNTCRFYPSCSHYAYQFIYKYGAFRGVPRAIWRVLRCNPFNPGGFDPVP